MESVVDQPLRDVFDGDSGAILEWTHVDDAFMSHAAMRSPVKQRIVALEPLGDVIGVQDSSVRRGEQSIATHHDDIGP